MGSKINSHRQLLVGNSNWFALSSHFSRFFLSRSDRGFQNTFGAMQSDKPCASALVQDAKPEARS